MAQFYDILQGNYFLLSIFLFPVIIYLIFLKQFKSSVASRIPPGPTPWPIVGNIFHLGKMPHVALANLAETYGPDLISLRLGTTYLIVGSSTAAAVEILKTHDRILSARFAPKVSPFKQSELERSSMVLNEVCSDGWRYLRTLCKTELFSSKALDNQSCLREKKISQMVEHLRANKEGKVVNIRELAFATLFNVLGNVFCSRDLTSFEDGGGMKGIIERLLEIGGIPDLSEFYPILLKLDLQGLRKETKELFARHSDLWELIIEERRKSGTSLRHQDFLDILIHKHFTIAQINHLLAELFTGGTDSSASTVQWAMAELMKCPESMKKVREELNREINQNSLKESSVMKLTYLQACIKETLRLHPPGPFLVPRRAAETCQMMNYTIPENARIVINVWAIGRDPSIWEEPLKFRPERFLNSSLDFKGNDFEFLPFGSGRRMCPGMPMAARQVQLILASLIHFFDWTLTNGYDPEELDMREKFGATLHKKEPLLLIPKPRK